MADTMTSPPFPLVDRIIDFEDGTITPEDYLDLFGYLVATGMAWTLQGTYGRTAADLIEAGCITPDGDVVGFPE